MSFVERGSAGVQSETVSSRGKQEEDADEFSPTSPEHKLAIQQLEQAKKLLLSASIAFCDNLISAGQLRAVRELLRERELRAIQFEMAAASKQREPEPPSPRPTESPARVEEAEAAAPRQSVRPPTSGEETPSGIFREPVPVDVPEEDLGRREIKAKLDALDEKLRYLEQDFRAGRINASQYRAVRQHYLKQREAALRIYQTQPGSQRWQTVLEEGKTTFLLQLNEAACHGIAIYDLETRHRLYEEGELPAAAEEAVALLGTFRSPNSSGTGTRMYATQADDGTTLLLIPGKFSAALVVFSEPPPGWQVGALREVHRNFEAANQASLSRGNTDHLLFPDLSRFIKT